MKKILTALCAIAIAVAPAVAQNVKELENKAKGGDSAAMLELAGCFLNGTNGAAKDAKKAKDWYEKAVKAGNLDGYEGLVACYESWDGIEKNPKKAFEYIYKGAKAGSPKMKLRLGKAYENGEGVNKNIQAAADEYIDAAYSDVMEAFVPAIKAANAAGRYEDMLYLSYMMANYGNDLTPEEVETGNKGCAIAFLHAGEPKIAKAYIAKTGNSLDVVADLLAYAMKGENDFEESALSARPFGGVPAFKMQPDKNLYVEALSAALQSAPDDAYSNFLRGVEAVLRDNWPSAESYFAKAAAQGDGNSYAILEGLASSSSYNMARKALMISNDPILVYTLNYIEQADLLKGKQVQHPSANPGGDIATLLKWMLKGESYKPRQESLYFGMESLYNQPQFFYEVKPLANSGNVAAYRLAKRVADDVAHNRWRLSDSDKAMLESVKLKNYSPRYFTLSDVARHLYGYITKYNEATNEETKKIYGSKFNYGVYIVKDCMADTPVKMNAIYFFLGDDDKAEYFNKVALEHPDQLLEWTKEREDVTAVAPGMSVPDLLETAGKHATGKARSDIEEYLRTKYGRSL